MPQNTPPLTIMPQSNPNSYNKHCERTAHCPRCGYDQRGKIQQWVDSCPLRGLCTECGLEFDWCELLSSKLAKPDWSVEYFSSWWALPWRSVKTLVRTFWPYGFWRSLKMTQEICWRRIAAYLLLMLATCYVLFCLAHGALVWGAWNKMGNSFTGTTAWRMTVSGSPIDYGELLKAMVNPWSADAPTGPAPPSMARGITTGTIIITLLSPKQLLRWRWGERLYPIGLLLMTHCFAALWFITLPISRRRAKVRRGHILRILVYGFLLMVPAAVLMLPAEVLERQNLLIQTGLVRFLNTLSVICLVSVLPMLIIWWSTATGRYLKMRHAWAVGVMMVVLASLTTLIIYAGMTGYLLMGWKMYL